MKLNRATHPVERIGAIAETKQFGIKTTAKAFQVLSSKLYKNKIAAAIRELACNAYDSHVAVWRGDLPFEVHLPTAFEPYFSIRDFGTGLDHTAMTTVFTTFFESLKEDSNDYIGALGLGCKSPFSYVDSFVVYAYNGMTCSTYECFLENGLPMISRKAVSPSNEQTGLEISFPVQIDDIDKFGNEARSIFRWFDVRPTLTGNKITIPDRPVKRGSCWSVGSGMSAIMGQVRYPLDPEMVGSDLRNLNIHFDIGEVDIQAGREELSYDKTTIAAIQARLGIVRAEINAIYDKALTGAQNLLEAHDRIMVSTEKQLLQIVTPSWRGIPLTGALQTSFADYGKIADFGDRMILEETDLSDKIVVVADTDKTSRKRISIWRAGAGQNRVGYLVTPKATVTRDSITEIFGNMEMVFMSDIPIPSRRALLRTMTMSHSLEIRQKAERQIDLNKGGVYLMTKNLNAVHPTQVDHVIYPQTVVDFHRVMLLELWSRAPDDGKPIVDDVAIIPWSRRGEMGEGWVNVYDLMAECYRERKKTKAFRDTLRRARAFRWFEARALGANIQFHKMVDLIPLLDDNPVKSFLLNWQQCSADYKSHHPWTIYEDTVAGKPVHAVESLWSEWAKIMADFALVHDTYANRNGPKNIPNIVVQDIALYANLKHSTKLSTK